MKKTGSQARGGRDEIHAGVLYFSAVEHYCSLRLAYAGNGSAWPFSPMHFSTHVLLFHSADDHLTEKAWEHDMILWPLFCFLDLGTGSKIDATAVRNVVDPFSLGGWPFGREGRVLITGQTVGIYDSIVQKCTFFGFQLLISYWFWCVHSREAVVWFYFGCWTFCFISDGTTTCSVWSDYLVVGWEWTAQHTW